MERECEIESYVLKKKIGEGSFGEVYEAEREGRLYAVKTEHINTLKPMLALEYCIYRELQRRQPLFSRGQNFPIVFEYIQKEYFSYLVMEKLDITLQDLVNGSLKNQLEADTFILIIYNTLKCIQHLHQLGYVYRDVKPANFMLRNTQQQPPNTQQQQQPPNNQQQQPPSTQQTPITQICLIDLGLCKKYLKKDSQEHIPLRANKKMIGTPIFCSINTHKGLEISRRDDLQSWFYMAVYFVKKLPWEELALKSRSQTKEEKQAMYKDIAKVKEEASLSELVKDEKKIPSCLTKIYQHIKSLQFQTRPNYEFIYSLLEQEYRKTTGLKSSLKDTYFTPKSASMSGKPTKDAASKTIKIKFKLPEKRKEVKLVNLQKQQKTVNE